MTFARAVTGLVAVLALAPFPAWAGTQVLSTSLVCAELITEPELMVSQTSGSGSGILETAGANVNVKLKMAGLPPASPVGCALLCVVDGSIDFFNFHDFSPCGTTGGNGKFNFTGSVPFAEFGGGCLLPIVALRVSSPPPPEEAVAPVGSSVVCAPGFGTFADFPPPCTGLSACLEQ